MKKLTILFSLVLMTFVLGFASCSSDDDNDKPQTAAGKIAGVYSGTDSVTIGGKYGPYTAEGSKYTVKANSDGSIDLTETEQSYAATAIGDITQGSFTIPSIPYDAASGSFYIDLTKTSVKAHVKVVNNGRTMMDADYSFSKGSVRITPLYAGSIKVEKTYRYGTMPFDIVAVFIGKR